MKYQAGQSGNPGGRPKGACGGRTRALKALDKMIGRKRTEAKMIRALDDYVDKKPLEFIKTIVIPLLPKESKVSMAHDGIVMWRNLLGQDVKAGEAPRDAGASSDS